mmetsp:Transcript_28154/g.41588  ORF Transcript_28154/g.41588 Transcript_28154/m.41588 type:complete len:130 (+) Transcript_28154:116-505(+)
MVTASDKIDWQAIIAKAEELHTREQELFRLHNSKERRMFAQRQRHELAKRRRYDTIGSFSVNMLARRTDSQQSLTSRSVASSAGSILHEEGSFDRGSWTSQSLSPEPIMSDTSSSGMSVIDDQLEADSD